VSAQSTKVADLNRTSTFRSKLSMAFEIKRWTRMGIGAAIAGGLVFGGCSGEQGETGALPAGEDHSAHMAGTAGEGEGGVGGEGVGVDGAALNMASLAAEKRVAFMSGHVKAGLALYRAGALADAAPHLLHPVSETHASERAGLNALGFNEAPFRDVSAALAAGKPAADIAPLLAAAEANLQTVRVAAGGDPAEIIDFLMTVCLAEYKVGVIGDKVTELGEYQDAYGFAMVARDMAAELRPDPVDPLRIELEMLARMWPKEGPVSGGSIAPVPVVASQIARVKLELSTLAQ
jgi:hypothetical protein